MNGPERRPAGAVACRAPWTALHFDQHGWVTACTANKRDALGNVATSTLEEIWHGLAAQRFRSAFGDGSLGAGCDLCSWQRSHGGDEAMYARLYDGGEIADEMAGPVHVEFAMSNRCNLACEMCNGALSSTIRQRRDGLPPLASAYPDRFFDELRAFTPTLARAKFLGGEPFLAPEN
ncbi:MAG: SPASM domain-containing protein, partial [Aquihabitans sp.]